MDTADICFPTGVREVVVSHRSEAEILGMVEYYDLKAIELYKKLLAGLSGQEYMNCLSDYNTAHAVRLTLLWFTGETNHIDLLEEGPLDTVGD